MEIFLSTANSTNAQNLSTEADDSPSALQASFESWGRYPRVRQQLVPLNWADEFPRRLPAGVSSLPAGMARSYGDVGLNDGNALLVTTAVNRILGWDGATGRIRCEAGLTLADLIEFCVPLGWFPPVVPGTKFVTIGGAIANDIHGKNHHVAGNFGNHVTTFELIRSDGTRAVCSPTQNADMFRATIGGMGLTGLIAWAEIQLRPIQSPNIAYAGTKFHGLDEFLAISKASKAEYTVAWLDTVSKGRNWARGIFMEGDHSTAEAPLRTGKTARLPFPVDLPDIALNATTVGLFNFAFYNKQLGKRVNTLVHYDPFFFPLDAVHNWNRMYGKAGFLQFQCVVDAEAMPAIIKVVSDAGLSSFLAVLKVFGDVPSRGLMSFPKPGWTLALDFPIRGDRTFKLFDRLAQMTLEAGGRLYPAKDARMTPEQFQAFYPQWKEFSQFMDPAFSSSFWRRVTR
jgi:FAD/FMN-containing dehydrogenase